MPAHLPGHEFVRPPPSSVLSRGPLSKSDVDDFHRDGYIVARGLLSREEVTALREGAVAVEAASPRRGDANLYERLAFRAWNHHPSFLHVATASPVAAAVAQLTPHTDGERGLVVLNDAYFRLKGGNVGCGFHVDDSFFWPTKQGAPGPGVNAWIPLDDVTEDGGGLTIAPRSYGQDFLPCRDAIQGKTENGFPATCRLAKIDPGLAKKLEDISVTPLLSAGDVLLHTRFLFHRGEPFRSGSAGQEGPGIARYSIRYMPGDAIVDEKHYVEGKVVSEPSVRLEDADPSRFPAVKLHSFASAS